MKKILFIILLSTLPSTVFWNIFTEITTSDITLKYISYDISSEIYNIKVWISEDAVSLSELSQQYNGVTSINWVFFCPEDYSRCNGLNYTINERFLDGEDLSFYKDTGERWVFAWDEDWTPFIHKTGQINAKKRDKIAEWLGNFPILLNGWKDTLAYYDYVGLYDNKMKASLPRHFICSNKEKTHIFMWRSSAISLDWLTPALQDIWCWDALNLDAWASSHFNYNGHEIVKWKRKIIDAIIIQRSDLDVISIETQVEFKIQKIRAIYNSYPRHIALERLNTILYYLSSQRANIYDQYSVNNYDLNWNIIGYTLEVTSLPDLENIYRINILEREFKKLYVEIKN
jgi:hypothetical protein